MKQSSIEWLEKELYEKFEVKGDAILYYEILDKAKEMHKQESEFMFECGRNFQLTAEGTFKEVYNETYNIKR